MNELVHLFHWDVHSMISGNVTLELQEVSSHIVDVNERVLLMNVVLGNIDVEVVEPILIQS